MPRELKYNNFFIQDFLKQMPDWCFEVSAEMKILQKELKEIKEKLLDFFLDQEKKRPNAINMSGENSNFENILVTDLMSNKATQTDPETVDTTTQTELPTESESIIETQPQSQNSEQSEQTYNT